MRPPAGAGKVFDVDNGALVGAGAVAVAAVLGAGVYLSGKTERDSRARVADVRTAGTVEEAPEVGKLAEKARYDPMRFAEQVKEDATRFGMADASVTSLAEVQTPETPIEEPITVGGKGKPWTGAGLSIAASVEKVKYQEHGATVSAKHSVITVTNERETPVAYRVLAESAGAEKCEVRGARMHNAMALMPGESAEIVVCAGTSRTKIDRLDVMPISELGYYYVSQLPPTLVGYDGITDRAHRPAKNLERCRVDVGGIAGWMEDGKTSWADVIAFYSRHNCHRYAFFVEYERSDEPLARLPVVPPYLE